MVVSLVLQRLPAWQSTMRTAPVDRFTQAVIEPVAEDGMAASATPLPRTTVVLTPATKPATPR
jgi:hypothetical protein